MSLGLLAQIFVALSKHWLAAFTMLVTITSFRQLLGVAKCSLLAFTLAVLATSLGFESREISISFLLFSELLLQCLLGFFIALPWAIGFELFGTMGRLADSIRGAQFAELVLPSLGSRQSLLELFATVLSCVVLLPFGAYQLLINTYFATRFLSDDFLSGTSISQLALASISLISEVFKTSVLFLAPVLCISLLVDLIVLLLSRSIPRGSLHFEFFPIKMFLGLLMLASSAEQLSTGFEQFLVDIVDFGFSALSSSSRT